MVEGEEADAADADAAEAVFVGALDGEAVGVDFGAGGGRDEAVVTAGDLGEV